MEPVEDVALLEQLALGRVDVLAPERIVVPQPARLEADDAAARVREGEHQAKREVVVSALVRQPRGADLLGGEAALARLRDETLAAGEPEPELLRDLLAEPATGEIVAHGGTRLGLPEHALEVRRRLVEQRGQPFPSPARRIRLR